MNDWLRWFVRRRGRPNAEPAIDPSIARFVRELGAADPEMRSRAIEALAALSRETPIPAAAVAALIERLGDDDRTVRRATRTALLRVDSDARSLVDALRHGNQKIRTSAAATLPRLVTLDRPPVAALVASLQSADPTVRAGIVDTLVAIGEPASSALAEALIDDRLRPGAIAALGRIERTRPLPVAPLVRGLADRNSHRRRELARIIAREDPAVTMPSLIDALHDPRLRSGAVDALGELAERAAAAAGALATVARDQDGALALSAVRALERIGRPAAPSLMGLLVAPDVDAPFLRQTDFDDAFRSITGFERPRETMTAAVCGALARMDAVPELILALGYESDRVRRAAAEALGHVKTREEDVERALLRALRDRTVEVRDAATASLARQVPHPTRRLALLLDALAEGTGDAPEQLWRIATSEQTVELLIQDLERAEPASRSLKSTVLRRIADALSTEPVESADGRRHVVDYRELRPDDIERMRRERPDVFEQLSHLHTPGTQFNVTGPRARGTDDDVRELAARVRQRQMMLAMADATLAREAMAPEPQADAPRWILARVFERSGPLSSPAAALRADTPHELHVIIGAERDGWLAARGEASESIDRKLPPGAYDLTVVLFLPLQGTTQSAPLRLPPSGPSRKAAVFQFDAGSAGDTFEALITIVYRGRVLQTAVLSGAVVEDPASAAPGERITLRLQVLVPTLDDLHGREPFDAALIATLGPDRAAVAGAVVGAADGGDVVSFPQRRIPHGAQKIRDLLERAVTDPDGETDLTSSASRQLLWDLAQEGRLLYEAIGEPLEQQLRGRDLSRLQLVQVDPDAFIPMEFVYGLAAPVNGAPLCSNWREALRGTPCTSEHHSTNALGHLEVVCPSGFWGVSKVIERQAVPFSNMVDSRDTDFALRAEPGTERTTLPAIRAALFAWSNKLDNVVAGTSTGVLQALNEATAQHAATADTWASWARTIERQHPELLVLLSHTVQDALEIGPEGSGELATAAQINSRFVKKQPDDAPIVFLLGCTTAVADRQLTSFAARLRDQGAALVVGTITPVLGERSAMVVKSVVKKLAEPREYPRPFGSLMQETRRELLAAGELTGLCAAAFGDATWLVP